MGILGRRARATSSTDPQPRAVPAWGVVLSWEWSSALRGERTSDFKTAVRARNRDAVLEDSSSKMSRSN